VEHIPAEMEDRQAGEMNASPPRVYTCLITRGLLDADTCLAVGILYDMVDSASLITAKDVDARAHTVVLEEIRE